jgi:hypothetical protein
MAGAAASSLSVRPSLGGGSGTAVDGGGHRAGVCPRVLARGRVKETDGGGEQKWRRRQRQGWDPAVSTVG